jgi:hypothetical protein
MTEPSRPKRVVVVDADNPLVEIHGEFFWREDHDAAIAAARAAAYRDGYGAGWNDAVSGSMPRTISLVRRPSAASRLRRSLVWLFLVAGLLIVAMTIGQQLLRQR